jgi:hypothetical protein
VTQTTVYHWDMNVRSRNPLSRSHECCTCKFLRRHDFMLAFKDKDRDAEGSF